MRKRLVACILAVGLTALAPLQPAAAAPQTAGVAASEAGAFVSRINSLRESKGLNSLESYGELNAVAQQWAEHMAAEGGISHNASLPNEVSAPWQTLGENVGAGTDVDGLMEAFINSPAHYRNLVDADYGYVGVGVVWGADGRLYTCHVFMGMGDTAPAPAPAADDEAAPASDTGDSTGASEGARAGGAPSPAEAAPPPPPQGPAEPARVVTVLVALRTLNR